MLLSFKVKYITQLKESLCLPCDLGKGFRGFNIGFAFFLPLSLNTHIHPHVHVQQFHFLMLLFVFFSIDYHLPST